MVIPFCKHHAEQAGEASVRKRWAMVRCQPLERSQHTQKFSVSRVVRNSDVSITIHHDSQLEQDREAACEGQGSANKVLYTFRHVFTTVVCSDRLS